jgi:hypothetical protein
MDAQRRRVKLCVSLPPVQVRFLRETANKRTIAVSHVLQEIVFEHLQRTMRERREQARAGRRTPPRSDAPDDEA